MQMTKTVFTFALVMATASICATAQGQSGKKVFQITQTVNFVYGQGQTSTAESVSEILGQDGLLLTVDIYVQQAVIGSNPQETCNAIVWRGPADTAFGGIPVIQRSFFDRNPGSNGARSDQAFNLSVNPGVRYDAGETISSAVSSADSSAVCTVIFRYFFRAL